MVKMTQYCLFGVLLCSGALTACRDRSADCNRFDADCAPLVYAGLFPACIAGQYQAFAGAAGQSELVRGLEAVSDGVLVLANADGGFGGVQVVRAYSGGKDIAVMKRGFQGDLEWITFLGSAAADGADSAPLTAVELPEGYLIAFMTAQDWGSPTVAHGNPGTPQIALALVSRSGALISNTFLPTGTSNARMNRLMAKAGGGAIGIATVGGAFTAGAGVAENAPFGGNDIAIVEFDSSGAAVRHRYIGGAGAEAIALAGAAPLLDGGYAAIGVGQTALDASFANLTSPAQGNDDGLIIWLDANGRYRAHGFYGSPNEDFAYGAGDTPHGLVVAGLTKGQVAGALNAHSNVNGTNDDGYAALISNQTGQLKWYRYLGSAANETKEGAIAAAPLANGNIAVFGFGSPFDNPRRLGGGGASDFMAAQLSPTGAMVSLDFFGGSGEDQGIGLVRSCEGGLIYAGASEATFGSRFKTPHNNDGVFDSVVVKSSSDLSLSPLLD